MIRPQRAFALAELLFIGASMALLAGTVYLALVAHTRDSTGATTGQMDVAFDRAVRQWRQDILSAGAIEMTERVTTLTLTATAAAPSETITWRLRGEALTREIRTASDEAPRYQNYHVGAREISFERVGHGYRMRQGAGRHAVTRDGYATPIHPPSPLGMRAGDQ